MDTLKNIWSFISFLDDIISPATDAFNAEDYDAFFNSTDSDNTNNTSVKTNNTVK